MPSIIRYDLHGQVNLNKIKDHILYFGKKDFSFEFTNKYGITILSLHIEKIDNINNVFSMYMTKNGNSVSYEEDPLLKDIYLFDLFREGSGKDIDYVFIEENIDIILEIVRFICRLDINILFL